MKELHKRNRNPKYKKKYKVTKSSRQRELPPPPLTEPYVKLSLHTAPIVEPKDIHSYSTSRRAQGLVWRYVLTTFLLCDAFL